jgi:ATP-dependent helicase/nuclease subunit A
MNDNELIDVALDPQRSVVVEACAGSGKTWLLVSRILRLLLAGVAPGEILAITYTRKAAREIEDRLAEWLRLLAVAGADEVRDFLRARAVPEGEIETLLPRARGLFERVLEAEPALTVSTFHGWFARLVQGAPLTSDLAGFALHESGSRLREEVWQLFADAFARRQDEGAASLLWLLREAGIEGTRKLMFGLADRRAEWHAFAGAGEAGAERACARLREALGVTESPEAVARLLGDELFMHKLREYVAILRRSDLEGDLALAAQAEAAFAATQPEARFAAIAQTLLTEKGGARKREASKAAEKRFGPQLPRLLELHAWLCERVLAARAARQEERAYEFNRHAFVAGAAWLALLERYKRERRLMDFADLEWHVARMLADEAQAAFLQARLDARYRHILLDEFQDTNPLQWRILLDWLDAYGGDASARPRIFIVGDPKQSIYRFRRAEPRVFDHAADFLRQAYGAAALDQDATRRNAPALVEVINRLFGAAADFPHFRPHRSLNPGLPGRVELLPLCERGTVAPVAGHLRDPLREARVVTEDGRRREEAKQLAARIRQMVGSWAVIDAQSGQPRPARFGDVMILTRRRSILPEFERALREAGIPYLSVGRGGLLDTLEAADLIALLRCLSSSGDDLALAHALRAPMLGAGDDDLLGLALRREAGWWQRLQACAREAEAPAALARAARLLGGWRQAAARLPVHDLLDRIYHEGELEARYRAAVPAQMWPGVAANLEAFLALSLKVDAGRYPSLPRFLDELARQERAADEEAPSEGIIRADESADRVRLLTVHGAKGLEASIVWLIDAHHVRRPGEAWSVLLDWPPEAAQPAHLSLLGRKAARGARRAPLIEAEEARAAREDLNLLYVAMTRARQYFFASGIAEEGGARKASHYDRVAAALAAAGARDGIHGEACFADQAPAPRAEASPAAAVPACSFAPPGQQREAAGANALHGTLLHAALDWLSAGGAGEWPPPGVTAADWPALRDAARDILEAPALRVFFDPAHHLRAINEAEFVLADGRVGRIDRLVELEDAWWVLDYKSGAPSSQALGAHRPQLEAYRMAVGELFPGKPVRCGLIFAKGEWLEI